MYTKKRSFFQDGEYLAMTLLIEPHPETSAQLVRGLKQLHCDVEWVEQKIEQWVPVLLYQRDYHLILLDLQLPNARALIHNMREQVEAQISPIVGISAYPLTTEEQVLYRSAGMQALLTHPFTFANLRAVVETWVFSTEGDPKATPEVEEEWAQFRQQKERRFRDVSVGERSGSGE